jgi:Holliday junction DNA helicase RuvA
MIARLSGKILECHPGSMLLDVGGVGYAVQIPLSTFYALSASDGEVATLHIHTHVREDALQLFGFSTTQERTAFELLIGISGVGPRLALAILSGIGVDELEAAVARKDRPRLQRIPGVGKKTAERVLLELRDKLTARVVGEGEGATAGIAGEEREEDEIRTDAVSALVNLGYTRDTASRAVEGAAEQAGAGTGLEQLLRAALSRLLR